MWCSLQLMRGEWLMCWWLEGPDSLVHMQHCDSWKKATAWRLWYGNEKVIHISQDSLFSQSCRSDDPWQLMMIWRTWKKAMDPLLHLLVQNQVQRGVHFVVLSIRMKKHVWQLNGLWPQDNLSRGNLGAVEQLQKLFPEPGRLQFIFADLGDSKRVCFLSFHHLHKSYIVFIYFSFISWGNSTTFWKGCWRVKFLPFWHQFLLCTYLYCFSEVKMWCLFLWRKHSQSFSNLLQDPQQTK